MKTGPVPAGISAGRRLAVEGIGVALRPCESRGDTSMPKTRWLGRCRPRFSLFALRILFFSFLFFFGVFFLSKRMASGWTEDKFL